MKEPSAIKNDLFAPHQRAEQIDHLGDPLAQIEVSIDFALLAAEVDRVAPRAERARGDRPPFPTETMVRIVVLKHLNNLSDERMAFLLLDRLSDQRFCGLTHARNVPDRTTIWTFENRIGEAGAKALFEALDRQLMHKGFIARGGQMIDATLVPAPKQKISRKEKKIIRQDATPADWKPAQRRQKDTDASWTKKHGKSYFGYKLSVNVDKKHKFIRKIVTDTAKTNDSLHFERVLDPSNTSQDVYADRGYPSKGREAWLKENGYRSQIQRRGHKHKPLSEAQMQRNHRIAKSRARVEHVFAGIEQMGGKFLRTIGQARANFVMTMMATCYNMKRLAYFDRESITAL